MAATGILRRNSISLSWCVLQNVFRQRALGIILSGRSLVSSTNAIKTPKNPVDMKYRNLPIVHVNATFNNTLLTVTDPKGNTLAWVSAGTEGFKNARRGSSLAGQQVGNSAAKKATALGLQKVRVKLKGVGPGRQSSLKGLEAGGLRIVSITDVTPIPHNGCRPRKARRL